MKVMIFCDFWNFSLTKNDYDIDMNLDWKALPEVIVREVKGTNYIGCTVYASVDRENPSDAKLKAWLTNTVASFRGYSVKIFERKPKKPPYCKQCRREILSCPHCNEPLKLKVEKGNDTALVTDMLQSAWDGTFDVGVLLSSDRDYIPAITFVQKRGIKIIHASFNPEKARELSKTCWDKLDLRPFDKELRRNNNI